MKKLVPTKLGCLITSCASIDEATSWTKRALKFSEKPICLSKDKPASIREMIETGIENCNPEAAFAIVNADIILGDEILGIIPASRGLGRVWAACSFRWEFSGDERESGLDQVEGQGIDVFVLTPTVGRHILRDIPDFLHLGRCGWDNWMCGWLRKNISESRFWDFTDWRCVFHRRHASGSGRFPPFTEAENAAVLKHVSCAGMPRTRFQYPFI